MNIIANATTGVGGYSTIGNEFISELYNKYTKNIQLHTNPQPWVIPECAHPQYKSMMLELMKLNVDKPDLIYNLWTPMIVTKTMYPIPMILETMFETSKILPDWVDKCNRVDETWNPSKWGTKVFKDCGVENVVHMPFGMYFSNITDSIKKLDDDPRFKFLFINQYSVRKNVKTVIQAFLETFQATDNVVLYIRADVLTGLESVGFDSNTIIRDTTELKVENPDSPQIVILDNIVDETLHKLYNSVDVVVAPSSGEGFGKTVAEAGSHGVPSIITNWSATAEFINETNGFPIDYTLDYINLSDVEMKTYFMCEDMQWATPDYLQICEYMSYAFDHPNECKKLGKQCSKDIRSKFSWDKLLPARIEAMEALV